MASASRGDIYWVDFGPVESRAPAKLRPLLIVQVDEISHTAIGTVVGGALTSNLDARTHRAVFVPKEASGLSRDSVVRLTELMTIDKWQLEEYIGHLPTEYMIQVENALREVLGL
ncbi:MAG: type II toxin-antitoxin system PemK/MazF family toxin [Coriobacteriales bacterium]|nr:type II toxin-antitoxin system PemK/MazF family toxin [Coriobacteriales bacterium]